MLARRVRALSMRVAIFGAGGVGAYFGARLAEAGTELAVIARGAHLDAIRADGLRVDSVLGDMRVEPAITSASTADVGPVDVVLLGVKTWQVAEAMQSLGPLLGAETLVVPLQNGVETIDELTSALGERHVAGGVCGGFCFIVAPGHVRHIGGTTFIKFGELDGRKTRRVEALRDAFVRARVDAAVPDDIRVALWEKFLLVVPFGGLGAVTRAPIGVLRDAARHARAADARHARDRSDRPRARRAAAAGRRGTHARDPRLRDAERHLFVAARRCRR